MATKIVSAVDTGVDMWAENEHKKGILLGLKVDNQYSSDQKIQLMDNIVTDSGYTSGGSAYSAATYSGYGDAIKKFQITVPAGDSVSLGKEDCKGIEFLGRAMAVATTSHGNTVITAQYKLS